MQKDFIGATGAILNPPDNRDILLARVQAPVTRPKKYMTDISMIPVSNQLDKGTCVGQGEGGMAEFFNYIETKKYTKLSKRFLYGQCKKIDGIPDMQGTYPRIAGKVWFDEGIAEDALLSDDNSLPYGDYLKYEVTDKMKANARIYRTGGYAFVLPRLEDILQAIYQNKVVGVTFQFGAWGSLPVKPDPNPAVGSHRNYLYGYEEMENNGKPDAKIFHRNSWGEQWGDKGNGWFWFSDYKDYMFDLMAYTDIPNEIIEEAKTTNYEFTRTLKYGMNGVDVKELQKRLAKETASDGLPCFRYPTASAQEYTTYFGKETEKAVQRYQEKNGIVSSGTPTSTGYGQLGPSTRAKLNAQKKSSLKPLVDFKKGQLMKMMDIVGHPIVITEEARSIEKQNELYAQGRTKPGKIVTNAKGGESLHNYGVAFDVAFATKTGITYEGPWQEMAELAEVIGLSWGGWPNRAVEGFNHEMIAGWPGLIDQPHFEFLAGYSLSDFQKGIIDESKFAV